jgi:hypothetical protein
MEKDDNLINFPFLNDKYIILYDDIYNKAEYFYTKYNYIIVIFLSKDSNKKYENINYILEIYIDDYVEELLIKYSYFVVYLNEILISNNLIDFLNKYNKLIITDVMYIDEYIKYLNNDTSNESDNQYNINKLIINFIDKYRHNDENNIKINGKKNIELKNTKINYVEYNSLKINIMIYYLKNEMEIINVIQKKCIYENFKNKYIERIYIFGKDLENEITEKTENMIFNETDKYMSFKDFKDYANENLKNKIVCILRSDIILLNSPDLESLDTELNIENKKIYCLSRYDRLLNGSIVKYDKLNKILFSTEHDAWIFKCPLEINDIDNIILEKTHINDKYSELYFNFVLNKNNYNLVNDNNKYKIMRILYENNLENRQLLTNNINKNTLNETLEYLNLVPDSSINNVSIDNMLKIFNIDENEIYLIKCYLFNKYFKKKIIKELIY